MHQWKVVAGVGVGVVGVTTRFVRFGKRQGLCGWEEATAIAHEAATEHDLEFPVALQNAFSTHFLGVNRFAMQNAIGRVDNSAMQVTIHLGGPFCVSNFNRLELLSSLCATQPLGVVKLVLQSTTF